VVFQTEMGSGGEKNRHKTLSENYYRPFIRQGICMHKNQLNHSWKNTSDRTLHAGTTERMPLLLNQIIFSACIKS